MKNIVYSSRAPMRIGLAGGGTDLPSFFQLHQGRVFNATISLYAYTSIEIDLSKKFSITLESIDLNKKENYVRNNQQSSLKLLQVVADYFFQDIPKLGSLRISTYSDVPPGSGLGTSSTIVVSIIGCIDRFLNLGMSRYEIALLAFKLEREILGMAGGMQDQYAASFGGFNYIQFKTKEKIIVNNVKPTQAFKNWLEKTSILYYTGNSRLSSTIISDQEKSIQKNTSEYIQNMIKLSKLSTDLKESVLREKNNDFIEILKSCWNLKQKMSNKISTSETDLLFKKLRELGATSFKISGAGGGGFAFITCPFELKRSISDFLNSLNSGQVFNFSFIENGVESWKE